MPTDELDTQAVDQAVQDFQKIRYLYEKLEDAVVYDINQVFRERELDTKIHGGVKSRVKDVDSFRKKIADKKYDDPLQRTRDLLGVRIVCLYPGVLSEIDKVIRDTFTVLRYEDKSKSTAPELWRYSSVHYDCQLPATYSGLRYDDIKGLVFEIQVRTILQDAWATVEHKLGYKSEKQIPDELKREFSALAGLFHVADQRFQFIADRMEKRAQDAAKELAGLFRLAIEQERVGGSNTGDSSVLQAKIKELASRSDAVINRGTVKALLHGIYPGQRHARNYGYSVLAQDLESNEIKTLGAFGRLLLDGDAAALQQDQAGLTDVDLARLAISAVNKKFRSTQAERTL